MTHSSSSPRSSYQLDELGWLQFERVCSLVLEAQSGVKDLAWMGHCDAGRVARVEQDLVLAGHGIRLEGPVSVAVVWVRGDEPDGRRETALIKVLSGLLSELGFWCEDRLFVLTNIDSSSALAALQQEPRLRDRTVAVLGDRELGESLDRYAGVRAAMPSVLGLRDLTPLIAAPAWARSSLDVERARALARVFWPTRAYERARAVLARHLFVVLTGPPEMGKTAIAEMLALAQMTDGWEAYECHSPDQIWRDFDRGRKQLFVADDAFGSTEYRPDAAERWARSLGRLLAMLDRDHWLVWTSRPAPLKAGLGRVRRERGSERFPEPAEVLVDAGDLDLAEKTLILFRHAKAHRASESARELVRASALSIVEHPHFTPERIRRFVSDRLDALPALAREGGASFVREAVELELASPTDAMRISYRALDPEPREVLIALLDAPAGLIDERELTATVRCHHAGGLSRPLGETIDRLTDHFLRVTRLGIGWVHPSWRDLVIGELRDDPAARRRFLGACSVHGVMLALSHAGGSIGERRLPLLVDDEDWDRLAGRLRELERQLEDQDLAQLLLALREALGSELEPPQQTEARNLAEDALAASARAWDAQHQPLPVFLIESWYALRQAAHSAAVPPRLELTWAECHPGSPRSGRLDLSELVRADTWLEAAGILARYDPHTLAALGFFEHDQDLLERLAGTLERTTDADTRAVAESILTRIKEISGRAYDAAEHALATIEHEPLAREQWWVPEDIAAPPSSDRVPSAPVEFTREDVDRVLSDL